MIIEELLTELAKAAERGAPEIAARPSDGSFLESTLESAIAGHLPGVVSTSQQRRRFPVPGFHPAPYGADIEWMLDGTRNGIEVKVSDVVDSLFDVLKLATAVAHGIFTLGFCAVAATEGRWSRGDPVTAMFEAERGVLCDWPVAELLSGAGRDAVMVASGPRPNLVPARVGTMAGPRIVLPRAKTHVLRLLAVAATTDDLMPVEY